VRSDPATGGMQLTVADNGPGMTPEVADQAFDPFYTTKGDQGAGLGLATVWGIIRRHGGDVSLETDLGRGTRVHLHLPAVHERGSERHSIPPTQPSVGQGTPRIMILDDEPKVRAALRRVFVHLGFEVSEVGSVEEAREACRQYTFALLLSDGVVADGGVAGFIQEFSIQFRYAPVILVSGFLEEALALHGVARGRCAFLAKPFTVIELTHLVRELLPAYFLEPSSNE
jgi:two-component system, cell cycle sensor histidine kinase and response regulator CckA